MLDSAHATHRSVTSARAIRARKALLVVGLAIALLPFSCASQSAQELRINATAVAYGDTTARQSSSKPTTATAEVAEALWDEGQWTAWEAQVQQVAPPEVVVAGEPMHLDIHVVDTSGLPLRNAHVEVTWVLPGRQYRDWCETGVFGEASVQRTVGTAASGKPCIVAVTVSSDRGAAAAYCAFKPR